MQKPVIVIADLHLGLQRKYWPRPFAWVEKISPLQSAECDPASVSEFLLWLKDLEQKGRYRLPLAGKTGQFELKAPGTLVLLGDVLDLWDSSQWAVDMCSRSIFEVLANLQCEKIYLVGNHDGILTKVAGKSYPWGSSSLLVTKPIYPIQNNESEISALETTDSAYLFLHGQEFNKYFYALGGLDQIIGWLREAAVAFGDFSYILIALFLASLILLVLPLLGISVPLAAAAVTAVCAIMLILAIPGMFVSLARPVFNRRLSVKYKPEEAIRGFGRWWVGFEKGKKKPWENKGERNRHLYVVYGHTHLADIIREESMERVLGNRTPRNVTLMNIPSWTFDAKQPEYIPVRKDVFLYVDEKGYKFIQWDKNAKPPLRHLSESEVRNPWGLM